MTGVNTHNNFQPHRDLRTCVMRRNVSGTNKRKKMRLMFFFEMLVPSIQWRLLTNSFTVIFGDFSLILVILHVVDSDWTRQYDGIAS